MLLPNDDSLVLPDSDDGPLTIDATVPAWDGTMADLLGLVPAIFRSGTLADRDAVLTMLGTLDNTVWSRASFALEAQQSPRFADGVWLEEWGDFLKKPRIPAEDDPTYRARLLAPTDVVTPAAIKPAVQAVAAQYTQAQPLFFETTDAIYAGPATGSDPVIANSNNDPTSSTYATQSQHGVVPPWQAWTQPAGQATQNQTVVAAGARRLLANYPDKPTNPPAYTTPAVGAIFFIVLAADSNDDSQMPFCNTTAAITDYCAPATASDAVVANSNNDPSSSTYGTQPAHGVVPSTWSPNFCGPVGNTLMEQIRSEVEQRKAGGVGWFAFVDPLLGGAI